MPSIHLKWQVITEYQAGTNLATLQKKYNLSSSDLILEWVSRYSDFMPKELYSTPDVSPDRYPALRRYRQKQRELELRIARLEEFIKNRSY